MAEKTEVEQYLSKLKKASDMKKQRKYKPAPKSRTRRFLETSINNEEHVLKTQPEKLNSKRTSTEETFDTRPKKKIKTTEKKVKDKNDNQLYVDKNAVSAIEKTQLSSNSDNKLSENVPSKASESKNNEKSKSNRSSNKIVKKYESQHEKKRKLIQNNTKSRLKSKIYDRKNVEKVVLNNDINGEIINRPILNLEQKLETNNIKSESKSKKSNSKIENIEKVVLNNKPNMSVEIINVQNLEQKLKTTNKNNKSNSKNSDKKNVKNLEQKLRQKLKTTNKNNKSNSKNCDKKNVEKVALNNDMSGEIINVQNLEQKSETNSKKSESKYKKTNSKIKNTEKVTLNNNMKSEIIYVPNLEQKSETNSKKSESKYKKTNSKIKNTEKVTLNNNMKSEIIYVPNLEQKSETNSKKSKAQSEKYNSKIENKNVDDMSGENIVKNIHNVDNNYEDYIEMMIPTNNGDEQISRPNSHMSRRSNMNDDENSRPNSRISTCSSDLSAREIAHRLQKFFKTKGHRYHEVPDTVEYLTYDDDSELDNTADLEIGDVMSDTSYNSDGEPINNKPSFIEIEIKNNKVHRENTDSGILNETDVFDNQISALKSSDDRNINESANIEQNIESAALNENDQSIVKSKINTLVKQSNDTLTENNICIQKDKNQVENSCIDISCNFVETECTVNTSTQESDFKSLENQSSGNQTVETIKGNDNVSLKDQSIAKTENKLFKFEGVHDLMSYLSTCKSNTNLPITVDQSEPNIEENTNTWINSVNFRVEKNIIKNDDNKCLSCGQLYKSKYLFKNHSCITEIKEREIIEYDVKSTRYVCKCCSYSFLFASTLYHHYKIAHGIDEFLINKVVISCHLCTKHFVSKSTLESHLTAEHLCIESLPNFDINSVHFKCQICRLLYKTGQELLEHIKIEGENHVEPVIIHELSCIVCKIRIDNIKIENHYRSEHNGCYICKIIFKSNYELFVHEKQHDLGKIFFLQCYMCNDDFIDSQELLNHGKNVHNLKLLPSACNKIEKCINENRHTICLFCRKEFENMKSLNNHIIEKHRICDVCFNIYPDKDKFSKHMLSHSIYKCPNCTLILFDSYELYNHCEKEHGICIDIEEFELNAKQNCESKKENEEKLLDKENDLKKNESTEQSLQDVAHQKNSSKKSVITITQDAIATKLQEERIALMQGKQATTLLQQTSSMTYIPEIINQKSTSTQKISKQKNTSMKSITKIILDPISTVAQKLPQKPPEKSPKLITKIIPSAIISHNVAETIITLPPPGISLIQKPTVKIPQTSSYATETSTSKIYDPQTSRYATEASTSKIYEPQKSSYASTSKIYDPQTSRYASTSKIYDPQTSRYASTSKIYDPQKSSYASTSNIYDPQTSSYATDASNSKIYDPQTSSYATGSSTSKIYDPQTSSYATGSSTSKIYDPQTSIYATEKSTSKIYDPQTSSYASTSKIYDPQTSRYASTSKIYDPQKSSYASTFKIYDPQKSSYASTSYIYDPQTSSYATDASNSKIYDPQTSRYATGSSTSKIYDPQTSIYATGSSTSKIYDPQTSIYATGSSTSKIYDPQTSSYATDASTSKIYDPQTSSYATEKSTSKIFDPQTSSYATGSSTSKIYDPQTSSYATEKSTSKIYDPQTSSYATESSNSKMYYPQKSSYATDASTSKIYGPQKSSYATDASTSKIYDSQTSRYVVTETSTSKIDDPQTSSYATGSSTSKIYDQQKSSYATDASTSNIYDQQKLSYATDASTSKIYEPQKLSYATEASTYKIDEPDQNLICIYCDRNFDNHNYYSDHLYEIHEVIQCTSCNEFISEPNFTLHDCDDISIVEIYHK